MAKKRIKIEDRIILELIIAIREIPAPLLTAVCEGNLGDKKMLLASLKDYNINYNSFEEEGGGEGFIVLGEERFNVEDIKNFNFWVGYGASKGTSFGILINLDTTEKSSMSNKIIKFASMKQRDLAMVQLQRKIELFNKKFK